MKRLVCYKKLYGAGSVGPKSGIKQGMIVALAAKAMQNHSFTANDLMVNDTTR